MNEQKVREAIKYFKKEIDFAERRKSDCSEYCRECRQRLDWSE